MNNFGINRLCYQFISYNRKKEHENINEKLYYDEMFKKLCRIINSGLIKSLDNNYNAYYYIYLFCIKYKENLINRENILGIIENVPNYDCMSILEMTGKLDDIIILKMLYGIKEDKLKLYIGKFPFDYRYQILKRSEISDYIKDRIVRTYSKEEAIILSKIIKESYDTKSYYSLVENDDTYKDLTGEKEAYKKLKMFLKRK